MEKVKLKLDWATYEATKYACRNWHYSGTCPPPPHCKIGVWENEKYIGVVLFGHGTSNNLAKPYNLKYEQVAELQRVALNSHKTPVSKILAIAIKIIKTKYKDLRLLISFSDLNEKHIGTIYQAGNWIYSGVARSTPKFRTPNGKTVHQRQINNKGFHREFGQIRKCFKASECEKIIQLDKHRYLMPLDKEMKAQIEPLRKPYPKRDKQASSSFPDDSGGATPTVTLHKKVS